MRLAIGVYLLIDKGQVLGVFVFLRLWLFDISYSITHKTSFDFSLFASPKFLKGKDASIQITVNSIGIGVGIKFCTGSRRAAREPILLKLFIIGTLTC
jgi:hypothetical protein